MKIEIFKEGEKEEEKIVRLRLVKSVGSYGDNIYLIAVDSKGREMDCGKLLRFQPDGAIKSLSGIESDIGLPLDKDNRLIITKA